MNFVLSLLLVASTSALKVGHISDLHLHLKYDPYWGPEPDDEGDCVVNGGTLTDEKAPMGRYGCDVPIVLIETMFEEFNRSHGKQDVIILTGDFNAHHTAMSYPYDPATDPETYSLLLAQHAGLTQLIARYFPDTLVLPALGNNDSEFHDNPIPNDDAYFFNDYIYNLWFRLLPENVRSLSDLQKKDIYSNFISGGYYRVDLTDDISVLTLNTLYYDSERSSDLESGPHGATELAWLRQQLEDDSNRSRKFILTSHIYPGARYDSFALFRE